MHADLLQRAATMKQKLAAASQTGDGSRWVAVRYSKCFFRGFWKTAVFENQSRWFRDGNPVVQARPLHFVSLNRASPMPSLRWSGQMFAPPNHAMHPDLLQRAATMKGELVAASQTGDGCRWVAFRISNCFLRGFRKTAVLKTKADGSATENPSCKHDRCRSIAQARCRRSDGVLHCLRHPTMACTGLSQHGSSVGTKVVRCCVRR